MEKKLDCKGMACPLPVVTTKKAMEELTEDGIIEVTVDNETISLLQVRRSQMKNL